LKSDKQSLVFAAALALSLPLFAADSVRTVPLFRHGTIDEAGFANIAFADLDGDGKQEAISCATEAPFALSARGGSYATSWHGPATGCTGVTAGDRDGDGGAEVLVVTRRDGAKSRLLSFDPRSLGGPRVTVEIPGTYDAEDVAIGNVDGDAAAEVVVVTGGATYVYDGVTLALQWTATGAGGTIVHIGDVDGDSRAEVVVSGGGTASVLDAGAQTTKWGYAGGFGYTWALGNVDGDAKEEIVFGSYETVTILNGDTFTTSSWSGEWFDTLTVGDANGDGANEVVTGNNQWGEINGLDPASGAVLWHIANPGHGTRAVAVGDLENDGTREVVWGANFSFSGNGLVIGRAATVQHIWNSPNLDGPFSLVAGDVDNDGRIEYIVASAAGATGYTGSVIEVFDAATGASKGVLATAQSYSNDWEIAELAIGQLDDDPAREIVGRDGNGSIAVWDGATRELQFSSNATFSAHGMAVANIDGDPVDEIILAGSPSIIVLHGASNIIQKSIPLESGDGGQDVALADLDGNGTRELAISTMQHVYVYDVGTWTQLGHYDAPETMYGSTIAATAANGGTVVLGTSGALRTFTGTALTPAWSCPGTHYLVATGTIDGLPRIFASGEGSSLNVYTLGGVSCPTPATGAAGLGGLAGLEVYDATGDGRDDLITGTYSSADISLLGLSTETRGDVDGDEVITVDDIDAAADYVFGAVSGASPSADTNADQRISPNDLFLLISYKLAGGAEPQP
jgi:hypothetical protein